MKVKVCDRMVLEPSSYLSRISRIIFVEKNCHVEKFQLSLQNLNNLWSFIKVYAVFVPNLCREKSVRRKHVWRKKWQIWGLSIDGMYSYFRPFQHFSFFAANIWSQECVYASSARRMRPIIAQLLSRCNSSEKMK